MSPTLPRRIGAMFCPLNVHMWTVTPGATSRSTSCTSRVTLRTVLPFTFSAVFGAGMFGSRYL
ncbi:Uncharacterised protein [Mycobacterium tuberculosis]|nr:Uncharacterised protein [Mycobacterium tuberculosis]